VHGQVDIKCESSLFKSISRGKLPKMAEVGSSIRIVRGALERRKKPSVTLCFNRLLPVSALQRQRSTFHLAEKSAVRPVAGLTTHPGSIPSLSFTATLKRCLQPI
jgi:hypothetical protein